MAGKQKNPNGRYRRPDFDEPEVSSKQRKVRSVGYLISSASMASPLPLWSEHGYLKDGYIKDKHLPLIYDHVRAKKQKEAILSQNIPDDQVFSYNVFEEPGKYAPKTVPRIPAATLRHPRFCISANSHKIFEVAHDHSCQAGFEKA
jgi:hypothetical protein